MRNHAGGFSIPLAYSMYYIWGTRMLSGDFSYEFAVHPFTGSWKGADLHRCAIVYNFPAVSMSGAPGDATWGETVRPIGMDGDDVLLSALYVQNGQALTRMVETAGCAETARIGIPAGMHLTGTDLMGIGDRALSGTIDFQPWQIRTMRLDNGNRCPVSR